MVDKADGAPLGLELASAVFDRVRTCDNHCPFCFIYQLPKGMRKSLYLKDDDYRLSFLYGNFTTLTRFTEADMERVITERLGPLYVSIHATDPDVRTRLLRNRRGATSLRWLALLLDAGIEVHGQVVVCPGINDGAVLDETLLGVLDRFPTLATLGVVPLGVERAQPRAGDAAAHAAEAAAVVDTIERWQARFLDALGHRLVYASDEYYLLARRPFPRSTTTTAARSTRTASAWRARSRPRCAPRSRATRSRRPACAVRLLRMGRRRARRRLPRPRTNPPIPLVRSPTVTADDPPGHDLITGELGAQVLEPLLPELPGNVALLPVENRFFGGNIGVTGLLTGADSPRVLAGATPTATATCCPMSRSRAAGSSTARRSTNSRVRSRSSRPTARRSSRRSADERAELPVVADRRAAERRQVDARQPHRRHARRDRRGAARGHA